MIKKIQVILLYLIIFLLPFNFRHIFNFSSIQQTQSFRGQLEVSFFTFDFFIVLLLVLSLWIYRKKIFSKVGLKSLFKQPLFYFITFIVLSFFVTKVIPTNWYNLFRLLESIFLFIVARNLLKQYTVLTYFKFILFTGGVAQSTIAITQFVLQKSIGLTWLGESIINKNIHNVAKFSFEGEKYIRAYGTFPHPNVLGIFLLFALSSGLSLFLTKKNLLKNVRWHYRFIFYIEIFIILLGIILTYSRTTIVLTTMLLSVFIFKQRQLISKTYKFYCKKLHIPFFLQTTLAILFIFGAVFATYNILAPRLCLQCAGDHSWELRRIYQKEARIIIFQHPFLGVGLGNFTLASKNITDYEHFPWQLQPVHNLYLLIASEIGIIGLALFLWTIFFYFFKKSNLHLILNSPLDLFFISVLLISFFDHYFWTLPQGQLIFWLSFAIATIPKTKSIDSTKYHFGIVLKNIRYLIKELS